MEIIESKKIPFPFFNCEGVTEFLEVFFLCLQGLFYFPLHPLFSDQVIFFRIVSLFYYVDYSFLFFFFCLLSC